MPRQRHLERIRIKNRCVRKSRPDISHSATRTNQAAGMPQVCAVEGDGVTQVAVLMALGSQIMS